MLRRASELFEGDARLRAQVCWPELQLFWQWPVTLSGRMIHHSILCELRGWFRDIAGIRYLEGLSIMRGWEAAGLGIFGTLKANWAGSKAV